MKKEGTIIRWDEARGFGFIRSPQSSADVFLHVGDFRSHQGPPREGMRVTFEEIHVGGKGPRAMAVQVAGTAQATASQTRPTSSRRAGSERRQRAPSSGALFVLPLMLVYVALMAWATWAKLLPWWLPLVSVGLNLGAFMAYWHDKYAASQNTWRISEESLQCWSLAGGWGGAWFAQQILRHKSRKASFRATYFGAVVFHCAGFAAWIGWAWKMRLG